MLIELAGIEPALPMRFGRLPLTYNSTYTHA